MKKKTPKSALRDLNGEHATTSDSTKTYQGLRLLKRAELLAKLGISRTKLYHLTKSGGKDFDPTFPEGKSLNSKPTPNSPKCWLELDVDNWMLEKMGR